MVMSESRARLLRLVETAVMIAAAVALSYVKIWKMPQGGSVTLGSMVPILLVGLRHGTGWGVTAGALVGLIQYVLEPYFVHPAQFLLDYPLAFAALGLAGLARGRSLAAASWLGALALAGRFLAHLISGAIFFAEYAPAGQSPWVYSAIYNGSYMLPELVISGLLLMVLVPALQRALPSGIRAQNG
jgi:thiamine transporter